MKCHYLIIISIFVVATSPFASVLSVGNISAAAGDTAVAIQVNFANSVDLAGTEFCLGFDKHVLKFRRAELGARAALLSGSAVRRFATDSITFITFDFGGNNLAADSGNLLNLYFDVDSNTTEGIYPFVISEAIAVTDNLQIDSLYIQSSYIRIGCCVGTTGNVNASTAEIPDLSDLSLLIGYLTQTPRPDLPCLSEANVSVSGAIDLSDLSLLIAYLTVTPRPILPSCP